MTIITIICVLIIAALFFGGLWYIAALIIGIPLGMVSAVNRNRWPDHVCMVIALIGVSVPSFWIGIELILLFANKWHLLPAFEIGRASCRERV